MTGAFVHAADGWPLWYDLVPAVGERRGVVVAMHAMLVDRRTLSRPKGDGLAHCLAERGYDVLATDFRGHGRSLPHARMGGRWTYDDLVRRDIPAFVGAARERADGLPVFTVGHSLGSHTTLAAISEGGVVVDAHVGIAGGLWSDRLESSRRSRWVRRAALNAMRALAVTRGHFPSRRLGFGPADESPPYVADIRRISLTGEWRSRDGVDWRAGLSAVRTPVLWIASERDTFYTPPRSAHAFAAPLGDQLTMWVLRDGDFGLARAPDHMPLGASPASRPLWYGIADWLSDRQPRR